MAEAKPREKRNRTTTLAGATVDSWSDAADLANQVIRDSTGKPMWAATRAALFTAGDARVWMWPGEFSQWVTDQTVLWRKREKARPEPDPADPKPLEAIGLASNSTRKLALIRGDKPVSKVEALAMAHYAHGLRLPCPLGDVPATVAWFFPRFGSAYQIARWLEFDGDRLADRLRGFDTRGDGRHPRSVEVALLRALDWTWRVGPFCPYGEPTGVAVWPGQEVPQ